MPIDVYATLISSKNLDLKNYQAQSEWSALFGVFFWC